MLFFTFIITMLFGVLITTVCRALAVKIDLLDRPGGRKKHTGDIPLIGGICIFLVILVGMSFTGGFGQKINLVLAFSFIVLVAGLFDDLFILSWRLRILVQIAATFGVILTTNTYVESLGTLLIFEDIRLGSFGVIFTVLAVVGLTNAFNMLDGFDGVASLTAITSLIGVSLSNSISLFENQAVMYTVIALLVFLKFNLVENQKSKIFLGDAGSNFLGFWVAWLLIIESQGIDARLSPEFVIWCIALPILDFGRVMILRGKNKSNIFIADLSHIHHLLQQRNIPKSLIIVLIPTLNLAFIGVGFCLTNVVPSLATPIFILVLICYVTCMAKIFGDKKTKAG